MKKAAFISGTISLIVIASGVLFKTHHWTGANLILSFGMLFAVISLPLIAMHLSQANGTYKNTFIWWAVSVFLMAIGIFFKIMHYPGSIYLQTTGTVLFIVFTILLARKVYRGAQ